MQSSQPQQINGQLPQPQPYPAMPYNYPYPPPQVQPVQQGGVVYNPYGYVPNSPYAPPQQGMVYAQPQPVSKETISQIRHMEADKIIAQKEGKAWSSMMLKPQIYFANQNPDERVYILVKRHWISNLGWIIRNAFYAALPPIVLLTIFNLNISTSFLSIRAVLLGLLIYYSVIFTNIIRQFIDWYFDPFIVTNERILDYDFKPFGTYYVAEINLENVEDIKQKSAGLLGDIFNYGNIEVLGENNTTKIEFIDIPNPTRVRDIMADLIRIAKTYRYGT